MGQHDPRIDAYVANAAEFARPILTRLREIVHEACPDVQESLKWSMPSFGYAGGILCTMAAFKQHASFGFWKHSLVMGAGVEREGMGSFGKMASLKDLPPKREVVALIKKAMRLNEEGAKAQGGRRRSQSRPAPALPEDLAAALKANRKAKATFDAFSPSRQREYIEWITGAKREETRRKRLMQATEWLADGKPRNWKYMND